MLRGCELIETGGKPAVIPAQAGIQVVHLIDFQSNQPYELDSRLRGNDD